MVQFSDELRGSVGEPVMVKDDGKRMGGNGIITAIGANEEWVEVAMDDGRTRLTTYDRILFLNEESA